MRAAYKLSSTQFREFKRLGREPGDAWNFWKKIADEMMLDPHSIIADENLIPGLFTALPLNHGRWWCFPFALKCKKPPIELDESEYNI